MKRLKQPRIRVSEPILGVLPVYVDIPLKLINPNVTISLKDKYDLFSVKDRDYVTYFRKVAWARFDINKEKSLIKRLLKGISKPEGYLYYESFEV